MGKIRKWHIRAFLINSGLFFLWGIGSGVGIEAALFRSFVYSFPIVIALVVLKNWVDRMASKVQVKGTTEEPNSEGNKAEENHEFKPLVGSRQSQELEKMVAQDPQRAATVIRDLNDK